MKSICIALLVTLGLASFASAADKPNFSGEWKLNIAKSNFARAPPPASYTRKVMHAEPSITIENIQTGTPAGDLDDTVTFTTDGKQVSCQSSGADVKSSIRWDENALRLDSKVSVLGMDTAYNEKMTLSDDGKTMTDAVHVRAAQGDLDLTLVFERQP